MMISKKLSSDEISKLEQFIKSNKPKYLCMSYNSLYDAKKNYEKFHSLPITSYMIVASENYYSYALYKSVKGEIYIVCVNNQTLDSYNIWNDMAY